MIVYVAVIKIVSIKKCVQIFLKDILNLIFYLLCCLQAEEAEVASLASVTARREKMTKGKGSSTVSSRRSDQEMGRHNQIRTSPVHTQFLAALPGVDLVANRTGV